MISLNLLKDIEKKIR